MRDESIFLHFSKSQSTFFRATFCRLSCQKLNWTTGAGMQFVCNHVPEFEIIHISNINACLEFFTSKTVVHDFCSIFAESMGNKFVTQCFFCFCFKSSSINVSSGKRADFSTNKFNKMRNRHTRRNAVRREDKIWSNSRCAEWHIFLFNNHSNNPFLSVSGGKFISYFRDTKVAESYLNKFVSFLIFSNENKINDSLISMRNGNRRFSS